MLISAENPLNLYTENTEMFEDENKIEAKQLTRKIVCTSKIQLD